MVTLPEGWVAVNRIGRARKWVARGTNLVDSERLERASLNVSSDGGWSDRSNLERQITHQARPSENNGRLHLGPDRARMMMRAASARSVAAGLDLVERGPEPSGKPWLPITWVGIIGSLEVVIVLSGVRRLP